MHSEQKGFSLVEALVIILVIGVIGASGFLLYQNHHKKPVQSATTANQTTPPAGTTQSIDSLTANDAKGEAAIDAKHTTSETSAAQSSNSSAANIGGAYNESSL